MANAESSRLGSPLSILEHHGPSWNTHWNVLEHTLERPDGGAKAAGRCVPPVVRAEEAGSAPHSPLLGARKAARQLYRQSGNKKLESGQYRSSRQHGPSDGAVGRHGAARHGTQLRNCNQMKIFEGDKAICASVFCLRAFFPRLLARDGQTHARHAPAAPTQPPSLAGSPRQTLSAADGPSCGYFRFRRSVNHGTWPRDWRAGILVF